MSLSKEQKNILIQHLVDISNLSDKSKHGTIHSEDKAYEIMKEQSFEALGLDSLDVFELGLKADEIIPGINPDKFNLEMTSGIDDFFAEIEKQLNRGSDET